MRSSRLALPLAALLLASCDASADSTADATGAPAYAVLTEQAKSNVPLKAGSNVRHMNSNLVSGEGSISYDSVSGFLTLRRGLYRLSGYSMSTFGYQLPPGSDSTFYSAPGYAYLCNVETGAIQTLGTIQDPLVSELSNVDDVVAVPDTLVLYLGHQNGEKVNGLWLGTYAEGLGTDHAFARLTVERLGDAPADAAPPKPAGAHPCWPL
jgi:hypothetical protein